MRSPITLSVAQPRCHPHDVEANAVEHARIVAGAGARVVVFPELSLTGYHFDAQPIPDGDRRLAPLVAACGEHGAIALVGAPIAADGDRHIAMLAVDGDGATAVYHKMFLGSAEQAAFSPGGEPAVLDVDGWRLGLAVCKDTGVAAHAEATAELGIDVYVAGVLETLDDADVQPERARAVVEHHGVWVAIASFAGSTGEGFDQAAGGSAIWAPDGRLIASAGPDAGAWATAVLTTTD
ncbi:MAG: carbon-nitrogen hydrolase family protein [Acidimicrobiia bacterium]|nr:carbon-nitrogen hydrolase family protein [Acidimicrobiia bacterium]